MFTQTDKNWKNFEMAKGATIGEYGCLLTSICNILTTLGEKYTPLTLAIYLQQNNGFDNQGNLLWSVVNKLFHFIENKYLPTDTINWSNEKEVNYIVQLVYKNTGHFCNVQNVKDNIIIYFDVYDGLVKTIDKSKIISVREVIQK